MSSISPLFSFIVVVIPLFGQRETTWQEQHTVTFRNEKAG
ncbi:hypothetical protein BAME_15770 [Bacillus sp. M 2-6]|nr:hypothetical protein BAME_15770 [Bacillus sp. M 2-6]